MVEYLFGVHTADDFYGTHDWRRSIKTCYPLR